MNDVRLSLCIATFNRAPFIGETLRCICAQLQDGVEVVVLDGGSSDGTEEVVLSFKEAYPQLTYLRQERNGGVDRDFDLAVQGARGEYCWLMSDDDLIREGAVSAILERLAVCHPDLLVVNSEVGNADFSEVLDDRRLRIYEDRIYESNELEKLFLEAGLYLSFIGCVVIRREIWLERSREPYFGSLFIHMGVIFQRRLSLRALAIAEPWIRIRYGNAMWRPREFEVWMVKWPELIWSFDTLSDGSKEKYCPRPSIRQAFGLFILRAKGAYTINEYRKWIRPRGDPAWFRALALFVALFPGVVVNGLALMLYAHKRRRGVPGLGLEVFDLKRSRYSHYNWLQDSGTIR